MNFLKSKKMWLIGLGAIVSLSAVGGVVGGFWNKIANNQAVVLNNTSVSNQQETTSKPGLFSSRQALEMTQALSSDVAPTTSTTSEEEIGVTEEVIQPKTTYTGDPSVSDGSLMLGSAEFKLTDEETTNFKTILGVTNFSDDDNALIKSGWIPVNKNVWRLRKAINNPVVTAMFKNNKDRFLSIDNYQWDRSPLEVNNLDYRGWTKSVSSSSQINTSGEIVANGTTKVDGSIPVQHLLYTKEPKSYEALVVDVGNDANNLKAINLYLKTRQNFKILVLKNIQVDNDNLKIEFDKLPNSVEKLTLFWNAKTAHSLRNLYNNENIKELELNSTVLKAITPYSIPKNAYVPRDYGVSIAPEIFDFSGDKELTIDNLVKQLKFAQQKEATLRIFQGYFGGSGGYVAKLNLQNTKVTENDLSKVKELMSNRGYSWIGLTEKNVEYFNVELPKNMKELEEENN